MTTKIIANSSNEVPITKWNFPGGEVGVTISEHYRLDRVYSVEFHSRLRTSDDILSLLMLKNAYDYLTARGSKIHCRLKLLYTPYARQDRICNKGESFSLKVFCDLVNSMNFDEVIVYDPHSDVTPALINNCTVYDQVQIIKHCPEVLFNLTSGEYSLVSPDAGSLKKCYKLAREFGIRDLIRADKVRDLATGEITHTEVYGDVKGKDVIIVDDICDGGRTFTELAKKLREKGANKVHLFVTHGVFSKGLEPLFEHIDSIFTTDTVTRYTDHLSLDGKKHYVCSKISQHTFRI